MNHPREWNVYLVTDRSFSRGRSTLDIVTAAVEGGVSAVQLREKELDSRAFYEEGMKIRDFLRDCRVPLIVNDRLDIALAINADGVHIGQKDLPVKVARRILGPGFIIGVSVEGIADIGRHALEYADYLAVSPVFATGTKTDIATPWGLDGLRKVRGMTDLPLVAIGSMKAENAREVAIAGADCVAVVTAIVSADDPAVAARQLVMEVRAGKLARKESRDSRP
jgi:thiamine-phosphate pyrophosphorylase